MMDIRLPNITGKTEAEQIAQIRSYLHQLVEQLNWGLNAVESYQSGNTSAPVVYKQSENSTQQDAVDTFNSIKALIIKSADIVKAYEETIFKDFNIELPMITVVVLGISGFLINHGVLLIVGAIAAFLGFRFYIKTPEGKKRWHSFLISMPLFGNFLRNIYYSRMLTTLATLLRSGVTILNITFSSSKSLRIFLLPPPR